MKEVPGLKFNRANRRVLVFQKHPPFALEPQAMVLIRLIEEASHISRYELCVKASELIRTKSNISAIVSYHTRILVKMECIVIFELEQWQDICAQNFAQKPPPAVIGAAVMKHQIVYLPSVPPESLAVVANDRGGFSIESGDGKQVGNYATPEKVEQVIKQSLIERD